MNFFVHLIWIECQIEGPKQTFIKKYEDVCDRDCKRVIKKFGDLDEDAKKKSYNYALTCSKPYNTGNGDWVEYGCGFLDRACWKKSDDIEERNKGGKRNDFQFEDKHYGSDHVAQLHTFVIKSSNHHHHGSRRLVSVSEDVSSANLDQAPRFKKLFPAP